MNTFVIALLVSIGIATWIYTKMMKSSGGLVQNALIVTGVSFFIILIVLYTILGMVMPS